MRIGPFTLPPMGQDTLVIIKRVVLSAIPVMAVSMFLPSSVRLGSVSIDSALATIGLLMLTVPLVAVSLYQRSIGGHGGFGFALVHIWLPAIGISMVIIRSLLAVIPVPNIVSNVWGIFGTFLTFPLAQQLIELLSGSEDMDTGGRQVRYRE